MKKTAVVMLLMFFFVGYGEEINSGVVVEKRYVRGSTQIITSWNGQGFDHVFYEDPERWELSIRGVDRNGRNVVFIVVVTQDQFEQFEIGDKWEREESTHA